jgi:hypothetical protein
LKPFDVGSLRPVFDELASHRKEAAIELDQDAKLTRQPTERRTLNLLRVANAAKALDAIPAPGETVHMVVKGNFSLWDFVPAVLHLAAPSTIRRLDIATLGFSKSNVEELAAMLDDGRIAQVTLLYSVYFRSGDAGLCDSLHAEMERRGQKVFCCRTHAKVVLLELSDGRAIVFETSANLRSCRNVEQVTITHDRALLDFHRTWIEEIAGKAGKRGHR